MWLETIEENIWFFINIEIRKEKWHMNRKKLLIIIIATLAIIGIGVAIIIPIKTMGKRDTKTVQVTL